MAMKSLDHSSREKEHRERDFRQLQLSIIFICISENA